MNVAVDIQARRLVGRQDRGSIIEEVAEGAEALHAHVSGWALTHLRNSHIVDFEHRLIAMQGLLLSGEFADG